MQKEFNVKPWFQDVTPTDNDLKYGVVGGGFLPNYLFARVDRTTTTTLRAFVTRLLGNAVPWGSYVAPTPASFTQYAIFYDGTGTGTKELLRMESEKQLIECYPGMSYSAVLAYLRIPMGQLRHNLATQMSNTPDFDRPFGYHLKGADSLIDQQTNAGKLVIPPKTSMEWAFVNLSTDPKTPKTDFVMAQHCLSPYDPRVEQDAKAIVAMAKKNRRVNYVNGHLEPIGMDDSTFMTNFGVPPVTIQRDAIYYMDGSGPVMLSGELPAAKGVDT